MTAENSRKLNKVSTASETSSGTANMMTSATGIDTAMANAAWARRLAMSLGLNQPGNH
jgi:hypothetical protein